MMRAVGPLHPAHLFTATGTSPNGLSLGPAPCSTHSASVGSVWAQKGPGGAVRAIESGGGVLSSREPCR